MREFLDQMMDLMDDADIPKAEIGILATGFAVTVCVSGTWPDGDHRTNTAEYQWPDIEGDDSFLRDHVMDQIGALVDHLNDRWGG